jgi:hypothetical protein
LLTAPWLVKLSRCALVRGGNHIGGPGRGQVQEPVVEGLIFSIRSAIVPLPGRVWSGLVQPAAPLRRPRSMTRHGGTAYLLSVPELRPSGRVRSVSWLAALVLCGLFLAACGISPAGSVTSAAASHSALVPASHPVSRSTAASLRNVFGQPLLSPRVAVTASGVYVAWQLSPPGAAVTSSELTRIDAATGQIEARREVNSDIDQVMAAAGSLWVAAQSARNRTLLRLDPATLTDTGRWNVAGTARQTWGFHLAVAGGGLWVSAADLLIRLSLPTARETTSIAFPGAYSSDLSANAAGTVLIFSEADSSGRGSVQRRDPLTGALLASYPIQGVAAPAVAGPIDSSVWVSEATGMLGYVQRLGSTTLAPDGSRCWEGRSTSTCVEGTNGISASLANGLLWVTQIAGGNARNYCAEPSDGRRLASIELPQPNEDEVLAIGPRQIFYSTLGPKASQYLRQELIPAACHARQ